MNELESILLIILTNLLFFWQTLNYYYVSDDIPCSAQPSKEREKDINDLGGMMQTLSAKYPQQRHVIIPKLNELMVKWATEPPKSFWKGVWQQLRGQRYFNPKQAHAITLIIHIINCVLIYVVFGMGYKSLLAALFFSINPINTQGGSIWLSGKPYSTATTLTLLMYGLPWLSPIFYYLTTFCSANAILSPLPFALSPLWFFALMPVIAFAVLKKVIMKKWCLQNCTNKEMVTFAPRKIIPFFKSFGYYFRICAMPYKLGLYHSFLWGVGVSKHYNKYAYKIDKNFWIGVGFAILGIGLIILNPSNMLGFGLFWFMVNIAMFCNLVTIQQQIAERYVYLSNIGMMMALAYFASFSPVLTAIILTYYGTRLWYYRYAYMNDYWFIEYNLIEQNNAHYGWIARGIKKFYLNDFDGALRDFAEARTHIPHDFKVNFNMASMLLILGDLNQCEEYLKHAEETTYEGVEENQKQEFTYFTRKIIEKVKKEGKLNLAEVRIIK